MSDLTDAAVPTISDRLDPDTRDKLGAWIGIETGTYEPEALRELHQDAN